MNKRKIIIALFVLSIFSSLYSQEKITATQLLKKVSSIYSKNENLSFNTQYNLYLDYTTKKVYEQYRGMILKKKNVNYFKIKNTEFVAFKDYGLKISHEEKALIIEKSASTMQNSPLMLYDYNKDFSSKIIESNQNYYVCELVPAAKVSQIMLSKVLIYIKKADYTISKQVLYFIEKMESEDEKKRIKESIPRLEIVFTPRIKNEVKDNLLVKKDNYFTEKGNTIVISKRFSKYQIIKL